LPKPSQFQGIKGKREKAESLTKAGYMDEKNTQLQTDLIED
jgi:hypothetical protein